MKATGQIKDKVVELYQSLGRIKLVASEIKLSEKTVRNILKERKIVTTPREQRNKKYTLDEHYLDEIDSHEKAYVLGFIVGDGNIRNLNPGYALRVELNTEDEEILVKLRDAFGSNAPIKRRIRKRKDTTTYSSYLILCSKHLYHILRGYGLEDDKTFTCDYPNIPQEFDSSFILGLNDADGHIKIDSENRVNWNLICTVSIGVKINKILENYGISNRNVANNNNSEEMSNIVITRKDMAIKLKEYLYSHHSGYLQRKKSVFQKIHYKRDNND